MDGTEALVENRLADEHSVAEDARRRSALLDKEQVEPFTFFRDVFATCKIPWSK
jgi:hypothetical protein